MAIRIARRQLLASVALAAALPLLGVTSAAGQPPEALPATGPPSHAERQFSVMTYNIYLGANIARPIGQTGPALIEAAAATFDEMVQTDFPERAEAIADLIAEHRPHVIGLQEVAHWETAPLADPANLTTFVDFLPVLLDALGDRGVGYEAAAVNTNFVGNLPISETTIARLTMRDVILVRTDLPTSQLKWSNPSSHNYSTSLFVPVGDQFVEVLRGWSTIDVKIRGKTYRFANTHLEAFNQQVRAAQAMELAAVLADSPYPVVLAGDLNSLRGVAGDSHQILTDAGYADAWVAAMGDAPGLTAGQASDLRNFPSALTHTVDYIMYTADSSVVAIPGSGDIVGDEPEDRTPSGLWPSDHAGVVVTLKIGRP
jgi:endonuclease/exonuclease/phosphatase family metal-dependent hydrolase